ncbi:MAG: hypothetical protein QNJ32_02840 [Xenococcaceae cyanobacterium MO_167.B27]|nr:hypothetical protein [Xenococcaceae cyanobacterium MO_167.B27]
MTTYLDIKTAIKQLPEKDIRQLSIWLQEYINDIWDKQIEEDLQSGKLDKLIAQAEVDIAKDNVKDINEIFNDN